MKTERSLDQTPNPRRKAVECEPHRHVKLWTYDLRTNPHFTLKENPLSAPPSTNSSPATSQRTARAKRIRALQKFAYEGLPKRDELKIDRLVQ